MTQINQRKRALYAFEFPDKSVYVGLTCDYNIRYKAHLKNSTKIIEKTEKMGHEFIMFNEWFNPKLAAKKEVALINEYKRNAWAVLNRTRGGELGSNILKWDRKKILEYVRTCKDYPEFTKKEPSAWAAAKKTNMLREIGSILKKRKLWNRSSVLREAKKHKTKSSFHKKSCGAWSYAKKNGFLNECYAHMKIKNDHTRKWSHEAIIKELKKYKSKSDLRKNQSGLYAKLIKTKKGRSYLSCYESLIKPNGYWTKEKMEKIALKYKHKRDLRLEYPTLRERATKMGIWNDICSHMTRPS